ncbi:hypothetical protein NAL32_21590 [Chryseobacterium sp. Ch-15]|uniref:Uncharacterized protein n=1 Tax=Chryseobacterium muglaense TaxID=2893752 RepID=A0A9Q3YTV7_9FLAO|nr:hypothetical protein [Chryseobacterium muglaense]MBD3907270.1 hypothetical protein [Chryseobacterium muglaense]MCC9033025.1 hypothetical protein [Chryseobacterium muglaense]MCM2556983.1 hypothetical protein [Chryseobacterium muglaense]
MNSDKPLYIKIHHSVISKNKQVAGPEIVKDYKIIDIPEAFSPDNTFRLKKGVHLIFELPEFYKIKAEQKPKEEQNEEQKLPLAPNIWKIEIIRKNDSKSKEEFIVVSDLILGSNEVGTPFSQNKEIIQIGKKFKNEDFKRLTGDYKRVELRSTGWGTLTFDSYYPNCKDVFGFHDDNYILGQEVTYHVQGWYCSETSYEMINIFINKTTAYVEGKIDLKNNEESVYNSPFNLAIGNSLEEAFTSLLLENNGYEKNKEEEEEKLEAILSYNDIYDEKLDLISRLRHFQHDKQFFVNSSYNRWVQNLSEKQSENLILDSDQKQKLSDLNFIQKKLDKTNFDLEKQLDNLTLKVNAVITENDVNKKQEVINQLKELIEKTNSTNNEIYINKQNFSSKRNRIDFPIEQVTDFKLYSAKNPSCLIELDNNDFMDIIHKVEWEVELITHDEEKLNKLYELNEQYSDLIIRNNIDRIHDPDDDLKSKYTYKGWSIVTDTIKLLIDAKAEVQNEEYFSALSDEIKTNFKKYINTGNKESEEREKYLYEFHLEDFNQIVNGYVSSIARFVNDFEDSDLKEASTILDQNKQHIFLFKEDKESLKINLLRNGAFKIKNLKFIDKFGSFMFNYDYKGLTSTVYTPPKQSIQYSPSSIELPPRLLTPLGMKLKFEKYKSTLVNDTPVLGWIIPVYINKHLEFFDSDGYHIGFIDEESKWNNSQFEFLREEKGVSKDINDDFKTIISWFTLSCEKDSKFKSNFIKEVQYTLEHIYPESYQDPSLMETIATTPIAITRTSIQLIHKVELDEEIINQSTPIILGDINQYNDGLIGYWHINEKNQSNDSFYVNNERFADFSPNVLTYIKSIYEGLNKDYKESEDGKQILEKFKEEVKNIDNKRIENLLKEKGKVDEFKNKVNSLKYDTSLLEELTKIKDYIKYEIIESLLRIEKEYRIDKQDIKDFLTNLMEQFSDSENGTINLHVIYKQYFKKAKYFINQLVEIGVFTREPSKEKLKYKFEDTKSILPLSKCGSDNLNVFTLLAPKSKLYVKTGLIPIQYISIPYNSIKEALNRIELTLLTSPIITPKEQIEISLLTDERYKWSWVDIEKPINYNNRKIHRIPQDISIDLSYLQENVRLKIKEDFTDKNYIVNITFFPDQPYIFYINKEKCEAFFNDKEVLQTLSDNNIKILKINAFNTDNAIIPNLILKEGWLSIKSTDN